MNKTRLTMLTVALLLAAGCGMVAEPQADPGTGKAEGPLEDQRVQKSCLQAMQKLPGMLSSAVLAQVEVMCNGLTCNQDVAGAQEDCRAFAGRYSSVETQVKSFEATVCDALRCKMNCSEGLDCLSKCTASPQQACVDACVLATSDGARTELELLFHCVSNGRNGLCQSMCSEGQTECDACLHTLCARQYKACEGR